MKIAMDYSTVGNQLSQAAAQAAAAQSATAQAASAIAGAESALAAMPTTIPVSDSDYFADVRARLAANDPTAPSLIQSMLEACFTVPLDGNGQPLYRDGNGNPQTLADYVTSTAAASAKASGISAATCDACTAAGANINVPGPAYLGAVDALAQAMGH